MIDPEQWFQRSILKPIKIHRLWEIAMQNGKIPQAMSRLVGGIFGLGFLGIGVSVLLFGGMGMPNVPIIFHLVRSFIAVMFIVMGGSAAYAAFFGASHIGQVQDRITSRLSNDFLDENIKSTLQGAGYRCERCGASLGEDADVSPRGDVKCTFCDQWFNIHS